MMLPYINNLYFNNITVVKTSISQKHDLTKQNFCEKSTKLGSNQENWFSKHQNAFFHKTLTFISARTAIGIAFMSASVRAPNEIFPLKKFNNLESKPCLRASLSMLAKK